MTDTNPPTGRAAIVMARHWMSLLPELSSHTLVLRGRPRPAQSV